MFLRKLTVILVPLAMLVLLQVVPYNLVWHYFQPLWLVRAAHPDWGARACFAETRSPRRNQLRRSVKNGAVLFNAIASPTGVWEIA